MKKTLLALLMAAAATACNTTGSDAPNASGPKGKADILGSTSITKNPDGTFTVVCDDGHTEIDTAAQILANQLCLAPPDGGADGGGDGGTDGGTDGGGNVYVLSNVSAGNEVIVYRRAEDGTLTLGSRFPTGGLGGRLYDPTDPFSSQGPLQLTPDGRFLLAVNAGSSEISVLHPDGDALTLVGKTASGGVFPVSLTIDQNNRVYVLHHGNTSGAPASLNGFTLGDDGTLTPIAGSTRNLSSSTLFAFTPSPTQIAFTPSGDALVVTFLSTPIDIFPVDASGVPSDTPVVSTGNSSGFGVAFDHAGHLLVTEPFSGAGGGGGLSSYEITTEKKTRSISTSIGDTQGTTCWATSSPGIPFVYVANNGGSSISGYRVGDDGTLALVGSGVLGGAGHPNDLSLTRDGRFLYVVNAGSGTVGSFQVNAQDGTLVSLGEVAGLPVDDGAAGLAVR